MPEVDVRFEPLSFSMIHHTNFLLVQYFTDGPEKNNLHSVVINGTYPLNLIDIASEPKYAELKDEIFAAMANNSNSFWEDKFILP